MIEVRYTQTDVTIFEADDIIQLNIAISKPPEAVSIDSELSFSLLVNTLDGIAKGLSPVEFIF